ncbi:lytic transglycosylase domain-containing protein [Mangrovibacter phragmitis]|uniref:lytic transglycosylase domain-containing protein n=1 Tax=Mangrovibacter phragmitis TaxID=1691903 RepID=UPI00336A8FA8
MDAKTVLEIDVNDEQFQSFLSKYKEYQDSVSKLPEAWRAVAGGIAAGGAAAKSFNDKLQETEKTTSNAKSDAELIAKSFTDGIVAINGMNKGLDNLNNTLEKANKHQESLRKSARATKSFFSGISREAKAFTGHIKEATSSLLSWGAVLGVFSGIVGAGGLFGINRLAATAAQQRFTALGLGTTTGGLESGAINFQRAVSNPVATMGAIRDAQLDVSKRWIFSAMGINNPDQDPASLMPRVIKGARDTFIRNGSTLQGAQAAGLTDIFSLDDLNRFKHMSDAEIDAMSRRAQQDSRQLQISDQVQREWQNFNVQLQRSGITIENSFIRGLAPLAPQLTRLSDAFSSAIDTVLKSPELGKWIDALSSGVKRFATYLTSPEFSEDVRSFMDALKNMGHAIGRFIDLLSGKTTLSEFMKGSSQITSSNTVTDPKTGQSYVPGSENDPRVWGPLKWLKRKSGVTPSQYDSYFEEAAKKYGEDPRVLKAITGAESNWNPAAISKAGAIGLMQVMPGNARPGENLLNPRDNIMAGARVFDWAMKQAGGDIDEALRYYNGGSRRGSIENQQYAGRVREQYRAMYGQDIAGPDTQIASNGTGSSKSEQLLQQILNALTTRPAPSIAVSSEPGTSALISSSQLGGFYG